LKVSENAKCGKAVFIRTPQKTPTPRALKRKRNYDTSINEVILNSSTPEKASEDDALEKFGMHVAAQL
jgi:hypothetical protein